MRLSTGDEAMTALLSFAREQQLRATQFTAIGAFSRVVVVYFDWETKAYHKIPIDQQVEVLSLVGDITFDGGTPVHLRRRFDPDSGLALIEPGSSSPR